MPSGDFKNNNKKKPHSLVDRVEYIFKSMRAQKIQTEKQNTCRAVAFCI